MHALRRDYRQSQALQQHRDTLLHFPACGCDRQEAGPSVAFDDAPADVPLDFVDQVAEGLELAVSDAFLVYRDKERRTKIVVSRAHEYSVTAKEKTNRIQQQIHSTYDRPTF